MSRQASPFTTAIRSMFAETNGAITHLEARPRLVAMGVEVATDPGEKSEELKKFEEALVASGAKFPKDESEIKGYYEAAMKAAGIPMSHLKALRDEHALHRAYISERNNFNVMKSQWKTAGGSGSSKPNTSVSAKGRGAKKATVVSARRGRPAKNRTENSSSVVMEAIQYIMENGGKSEVQAKVAELQAEVDRLNNILQVATEVAESLAA